MLEVFIPFILGTLVGIITVSVYLLNKRTTKKRREKLSALIAKIKRPQKPEPPS